MVRRNFLSIALISSFGILCRPISALNRFSAIRPKVKWGVAIITWKDEYLSAFEDLSKLNVKGIQIRGNVFEKYRSKPKELVTILNKFQLKAPILSGGNLPVDGSERQDVIDSFVSMADFVQKIGGKYLQVTTMARDAYPPGNDSLLKLSKSLNVIGELVKKKGVSLLLHNHMHQVCQNPNELDFVLKNTNPDFVGLLLDVAHYTQAGGNPSEAILKYKDRLELLHIKDLLSPKPGYKGKLDYNYQFVELGKGNKINFVDLLSSLQKIKFRGWCMIELDSVPESNVTPIEATKTSLDYLSKTFSYTF